MRIYLSFIHILPALLLFVSCGARPEAASVHPLVIQNKILSIEIPIARKRELYSVIDLAGRSIQVKIRGEKLSDIPIRELKIHKPWPESAVREILAAKGIAPEPRRMEVFPPKPGETVADTEVVMMERVEDSFEVEDMPAFYSLVFESGAQVLVIPSSDAKLGFFQRLPNAGLRALFFFKRLISGGPAATVMIDTDAARTLYWALTLKQKTIIASTPA